MKLSLVLVLTSFLALAGCGTLQGLEASYSPRVRAEPLIPADPASRDYVKLKQEVGEALNVSEDDVKKAESIMGVIQKADDNLVKSNRDFVAGMLLSRSNATCNRYLSEITSSQRTWRTTFSVLGLAFGTAGGIATPESSSQLLSALAGGMSGMSSKLDEGLLSNQAGHLIRAANINMRRELERQIIKDISPGGELADAPLPLLLAVVEDYHSRCSIDDGLSYLNLEVAKTASDSPASIPATPVAPGAPSDPATPATPAAQTNPTASGTPTEPPAP